ncbi:MAG: hypothetical protein U0V49_10065 [Saprospiraceae bacterium]
MNRILHFISLTMLLLVSCQKEQFRDTLSEIQGQWQWVETYGGISGEHYTPATEHINKSMTIQGYNLKYYENNFLKFQSGFELVLREPDQTIIRLGDKTEYVIEWEGNTLVLVEPCIDCYEHYYVRK